jgi:ATP-dependent Clp protease protease subunit
VKKNYFSLAKEGDVASLNIYADICHYAWETFGEVSAVNLSKQLEEMGDVKQINVYINSYGGEVAEGLAIYNALKRHKAKVTTYCDGFACSIASVIFMAGEERVMNEASMLMIHNAWTWASGNAEQLRKQADDLEKITQASVEAYKAHSSLSEEEIKALMDAETWILPEEALSYGFATKIEKTEKEKANQNALVKLFEIIKAYQAEEPEKADDDEGTEGENEPEKDEPETDTGAEEPEKDNPEEPEEPEEPDTDDEPEKDTDGEENKPEEEALQKMEGFFNAILNLN